ncbi:MAG: HD domain-containing protein [Patescibacteria group bacterium]
MQPQEIKDILAFLEESKALQSVERYGVSLRGAKNTVAEHSWRLGLMVLILCSKYQLKLDMSRALSLALIHDMAEAKTGDIDAYAQMNGGPDALSKKAAAEDAAMQSMTKGLSFGSHLYDLWREYEDQATVEAKFIKALDRIEGFLHIAEDGVSVYIPKEFHADYADKAVAAFDATAEHFPELKGLLDAIKEDLKAQFEKKGVAWISAD